MIFSMIQVSSSVNSHKSSFKLKIILCDCHRNKDSNIMRIFITGSVDMNSPFIFEIITLFKRASPGKGSCGLCSVSLSILALISFV